MILNLKWCQENKKILIKINEDRLLVNEDFSNIFDDNFIKKIVSNCNSMEDLKNNDLLIDFNSINELEDKVKIKSKLIILQEILNEFILGLNSAPAT